MNHYTAYTGDFFFFFLGELIRARKVHMDVIDSLNNIP